MPTGYTAPLHEGEEFTFEQFASRCARAFGALVMLRDEPMSDTLPKEFEPSPYHANRVKELEEELQKLNSMSIQEAEQAASEEHQDRQKRAKKGIKDDQIIKARYESMLAKARRWEPPTPDHVGLKDFMIKQLEDSINFDCSSRYYYDLLETPQESGGEWLKAKIADIEKSLIYSKKELSEEVKRTDTRNQWVQQLRKSLTPQQG